VSAAQIGSRCTGRRAVLALALAAGALGIVMPANPARGLEDQTATPGLRDRAFDLTAEAFPLDASPGRGSIGVSIRPDASHAAASNPPSAAHARAAATDLGLAEAYVGEQGPSAQADTDAAGTPPDAVFEQGGLRLTAHADASPRSAASADGSSSAAGALRVGELSSHAETDGSGDRLTAQAHARIAGIAIGPLTIGVASFDAVAAVDGQPGGATASARVAVTSATVAGVPVVIDDHGITVDTVTIPSTELTTATQVVHDALAQGGFLDVRVVQPRVDAAPEGTRVTIEGGGLQIHAASTDPQNPYFVDATLVGGSATVALGAPIGTAAPPSDGSSSEAGAAVGTGRSPEGIAAAPAVTPNAARGQLVRASQDSSYKLTGAWRGWPWLLAAIAALVGGTAILRGLVSRVPAAAPLAAGLRRRVDSFADRYLRG